MSNKIIDSHDLVERLEELRALQETLEQARTERDEVGDSPASTQEEIDAANDAVQDAERDFGEDEQKELDELETLENEVSDWYHGATLIREDYFTEYAQQLCEDIGDIPRNLPSYIVINWEETAENLKADYSIVSYQGHDYYVRS